MSLIPMLLLLVLAFSSAALSAMTVTHLPGFDGPLPFHLQTGYVSVGESNDAELFYYFIESERNPRDDPLILWLTGGPGCSGFSGLVLEIGPFKFVADMYNGSIPTLAYNGYSWTKFASIIFLDYPAGTGFSFSTTPRGYMYSDTTSSKQVYEFLRKWLMEHPHFLSNHLYIGGDSYGGKIVPIVTHQVAQGLEDGLHPLLNLKGYLVGNPITNATFDYNFRATYAHGMGIISDELYEAIQRDCQGEENYDNPDPLNLLCISTLHKFSKFTGELDIAFILDPICSRASPKRERTTRKRSLQDYLEFLLPPPVPDIKCRTYAAYLAYHWANSYESRKALHVKEGTVMEWVRCNTTIANTYMQDVSSSIIYHRNVTLKGFRALVYNGDMDMLISFVGTQAWIKTLNYPIVDDWRSWHADGQVAGYTRKYSNNLTFATVKGGGHTAPEHQPQRCFVMAKRWISHEPL